MRITENSFNLTRATILGLVGAALFALGACGESASGVPDPNEPLPQSWFDLYADDFRSDSVTVSVISKANARRFPTSRETGVITSYGPGDSLTGRWVAGADPTVDWFKTDSGLYVWGQNLTGPGPGTYSSAPSDNTATETTASSTTARRPGEWPDAERLMGWARAAAPDTATANSVVANAHYKSTDENGAEALYWSMCDQSCDEPWQSAIVVGVGRTAELCVKDARISATTAIWYRNGEETGRSKGACPSNLDAFNRD